MNEKKMTPCMECVFIIPKKNHKVALYRHYQAQVLENNLMTACLLNI